MNRWGIYEKGVDTIKPFRNDFINLDEKLVEKLVEKGYEVVVSLPEGDNKEIEALELE